MATYCDFELTYNGKHPLEAMRIVRDNMTISGLLELSYIGEHYIHLCVHRFNDEYYQDLIAEMDDLVKDGSGEYEIIAEKDMECRVNFTRYYPKDCVDCIHYRRYSKREGSKEYECDLGMTVAYDCINDDYSKKQYAWDEKNQ